MALGNSNYQEYLAELELQLKPRGAQLVRIPDFYGRVPPGSHIVAPSTDKSDPWIHAIYIGGRRVIHGKSDEMKEQNVNDFVDDTNAVTLIEYDEDGQWPRAATIRAIRFMKNIPLPKRFANVPVLCRAGVARYDRACERVDVLLKQNEVMLPRRTDRIILSPRDKTAERPNKFACSIHAGHLRGDLKRLTVHPKDLVVSSPTHSKFC